MSLLWTATEAGLSFIPNDDAFHVKAQSHRLSNLRHQLSQLQEISRPANSSIGPLVGQMMRHDHQSCKWMRVLLNVPVGT